MKNKNQYELDEIYSHIKKYFLYDSLSGIITRTDRKGSNGSLDKDGYLILKVKGRQFKSHRIAWFLYYGEFPNKEIDHINRNRTDNKISNLRDVDRIQNVRNTTPKINPNTNVVGVYIDRTKGLKKNFATKVNGKTYRFYSVDEALNFKNKIR